MHSSNVRCNALQSLVGVFLHSCNAPETIMEMLAHMGLSISVTTVNAAVANLSREAEVGIRTLGETVLAAYAYDNLDVDLKHQVPTAEKPQESLTHITTGTMIPLYHGINRRDLDCADILWNSYYRNPNVKMEDLPSSKVSFYDLLDIYPEVDHESGLTRRERFNAWKYLADLVSFGPEYFHKFIRKLKEPEAILAIPVTKTSQTPLRAVEVSPSTIEGNVWALKEFFKQANIGDPTDSSLEDNSQRKSIDNQVVLVFGDLLTGQHVRSVLESRSVEKTVWRRKQFMVFVMGLFHLKMACVDAIWRIFIHPKGSDTDSNSFMAHIGQIRPKETGKINSKPGFRRMHEVIQHVGIVGRLDMWRIAAKKCNSAHSDLTLFAGSKPEWGVLVEMANTMALQDTKNNDISRLRAQDDKKRDKQWENTILRTQYFSLYEEMSHAINHGDIGRVEDLFAPWIQIFLGCGKHKYATEMRRHLVNMHFVYPAGLRYVNLVPAIVISSNNPYHQASDTHEHTLQSNGQERALPSN